MKYGENDQYPGWEKVIAETSMLDLTGNYNNDASSVRVKPGCHLKLFDRHNNVGLLDSFIDDHDFHLSAHINDRVSSLSCTCLPSGPGRVKELFYIFWDLHTL